MTGNKTGLSCKLIWTFKGPLFTLKCLKIIKICNIVQLEKIVFLIKDISLLHCSVFFCVYYAHWERKIVVICEIEKYVANKINFWQLLVKIKRAAILRWLDTGASNFQVRFHFLLLSGIETLLIVSSAFN